MQKNDIKSRLHKSIKKAPYNSNIKRVAPFGSYAYGKPKKNSDVDVLIEFKPNSPIGLFEMVDRKTTLQKFSEGKLICGHQLV